MGDKHAVLEFASTVMPDIHRVIRIIPLVSPIKVMAVNPSWSRLSANGEL
jgi:hypothetical protein